MKSKDQPSGRDQVMKALVDATVDLIIERGTTVSVREIAARAGVNHGLVHTYFGSKTALLTAAFDEINAQAAVEVSETGFPPPDLATRRDSELGRAVARMLLEQDANLFSDHPITRDWVQALRRTQPELGDDEVNVRVAVATTLALGWSMYGSHIATIMNLDEDSRAALSKRVTETVAEIGGIPDR